MMTIGLLLLMLRIIVLDYYLMDIVIYIITRVVLKHTHHPMYRIMSSYVHNIS